MKTLDKFSNWIVTSKKRTLIFMIIIGFIMLLYVLLDVILGQEVLGVHIIIQNLSLALIPYAGYKLADLFLDFKNLLGTPKVKSILKFSIYIITILFFTISILSNSEILLTIISCVFCIVLGFWISAIDGTSL